MNSIIKFGGSTKRMTIWRGKSIVFNKKRTVFHEITKALGMEFGEHDSNGGRIMTGHILDLSEAEKKDVLRVWAIGKAAWMEEHKIAA